MDGETSPGKPRGHRRLQHEHVVPHDGEHLGTTSDMLAVFDIANRHEAARRRDHLGILDITRGGKQPGLRRAQSSVGRDERLLRRAQIALGNRAGLEQLLGLIGVPLRVHRIGLRGFDIGLRRPLGAHLGTRLEARHDLATPDAVAFANVHRFEVPLDARANRHFLDRLEVALDSHRQLDGALRDRVHVVGA
jgi:hypothetical protein